MACREATNLLDLLRIRERSKDKIDAINGNLGSALGFKHTAGVRTDHPAIIVFVPEKIREDLLEPSQVVPRVLEAEEEGGDVVYCKTDVVRGGKAAFPVVPAPLEGHNAKVVEELRNGRAGLIGGVQIAGYNSMGASYVGTAGCAVADREGRVGFLTNQHISGPRGRPIYCPDTGRSMIGKTSQSIEYVSDERHYDGMVDEKDALVRVDCGVIPVDAGVERRVKPGLYELGPLGETRRIDLLSMEIIGARVASVGRTRGVQRGTIVAYAYEWRDEERLSVYTDLLIVGDDPGGAFSYRGDSGKLIVTEDDNRPVGLLWGGWRERLRRGREQENWTYAINLGKVLEYLQVTILR